MNLQFIKKGIVIAVLAGAILIPSGEAEAAEITPIIALPKQNTEAQLDQNILINAVAEIKSEAVIENKIKIESAEEMKTNKMLSEKAFAVIGETGYLLVNSAADEESDWVGKIYETSQVKVISTSEGWSEIESGEVKGFVKSEDLLTGKDAIARAKEILAEKYVDIDIYTLDEEEIEAGFSVAETREAEEKRLAEEAARKKAEEEARKKAEAEAKAAALLAQGQSVVDYAKQFLGNPYVYGGTSLTNGTDCSGFVKSVYAHFGIYLPRTSSSMRSVGRAVSYNEMQPGDIVCYAGHVGIYAGNGMIVNAIDESHGIGMSSATYSNIITIRRMF